MNQLPKKVEPLIAPSILSADLSNLGYECEQLVKAGADWIHIDVMVNFYSFYLLTNWSLGPVIHLFSLILIPFSHFVPNLTLGAPVVKCLRKRIPNFFFDCHMMVAEPEKYVDDFADAGATLLTIHYEAAKGDTFQILTSYLTSKYWWHHF